MVKMKYKNMLAVGIIPSELEHLKNDQPLNIKLDDIDLPGHVLVIFVGKDNQALKRVFDEVSEKLDRGQTKLILPQVMKH